MQLKELIPRGIAVEFVKESIKFVGADSPTANLLLSWFGAVAERERALIPDCPDEDVLAKLRG